MALQALTSTKTADGEVKDSKGTVWEIRITPTGTAGEVKLRDGGAAGTVRDTITVPALGPDIKRVPYNQGMKCSTSIYVEVSNCTAIIYYT